jgi:hypothetical protein
MDFIDFSDPFMILYFAPVLLGIVYVFFSFFGERGE